ncbi:hypothetical protein OSB04_011584 [Centaurea solstitialis]|uniref:Uncharacterized protein n=1 Tax=Centaurea solstitialis TaxID=347529 RepID=A0AA38WLM6_9ASTR|nr:hypothetical protein OSB04_011584 [Centaurea solstitialis]
MTNGEHVIKNVRYVEGLPFNLFSSSQFCDSGYLVTQFVIDSTVKDEDDNETAFFLPKTDDFLQKTDLQQIRQ